MPVDERLQVALTASLSYRPDITVSTVLRHVVGRRVTALGDAGNQPVVVKVFHGQRARGNHRRLTALAAAGLTDIVPVSFGCDATGHVSVVEHRPGLGLEQLPDRAYVSACEAAGLALRRIHDSTAKLDRVWRLDDEVAQLGRRTPEGLQTLVADVAADARRAVESGFVPAHRDCHPRQLVIEGEHVAWIDLDDCAMAPRELDVGNMIAHLTREHVVGRRDRVTASASRCAFLDGYSWSFVPADLARWERLSLVRLAGLAETRHGAPGERDALLLELAAVVA
jgi:Ser/Thr protein kinase RdoA (MazF antagonist)